MGGAAVADLDHWPLTADDLGDAVDEMRWYLWDEAPPDRLVTPPGRRGPADGLAWALTAADAD